MIEHWVVSLNFKNDKEKEKFHELLKEHKGIFKDYKIDFGGYCMGDFSWPLIKIKKGS